MIRGQIFGWNKFSSGDSRSQMAYLAKDCENIRGKNFPIVNIEASEGLRVCRNVTWAMREMGASVRSKMEMRETIEGN